MATAVAPMPPSKKLDKAEALLQLCKSHDYVSIDKAFRSLLTMSPADLSRLPGTPATVMLAQTLSYLKSTNKLREPLLEDQTTFQRAHAILVTASKKKGN